VSIVTGAGSGIGKAIALRLADRGDITVLFGRDRRSLEATAADAAGDCALVEGDVRDQDSIERLLETATEAGEVSVLINNAGIMPIAPVETATLRDWQDTIETNLTGLLRLTHAVLPEMRRFGGGHVVLMSSVAGRHPFPAASVYSASKSAVDSFGEGLRAECAAAMKRGGPAIRVTTVAPGAVTTDLTGSINDDSTREGTEAYYAGMQAPLTPDDVANAVCFALDAPPHVCISDITIRPAEMVR